MNKPKALAEIDPLIYEGLATLERVDVRFYRSRADTVKGQSG